MRPGRERNLVTLALVLGMFLAALEATAVGTAMPSVVAELGGVSRYGWVFSVYLLTATTTVPLYGKLADLYGRRRLYLFAVAVFVVGSALSGGAQTLEQLILFRAIQGVGAGGVMPLTVTLVGDIFSLEERAKMQGIFAGVWGVSSLVGPAVGGLVTELISWRWVFYFNIPFGFGAALVLRAFLREEPTGEAKGLDVVGIITLTLALVLLLVGLLEGSTVWGWRDPATLGLLGAAAAGLAFFLWHQTHAAEPVLPLELFRNPVIAVSSIGSVIVGTLLFSTTAFVPMFTQGVLGGSARDAGLVLVAMGMGWPVASTLAGRLLLRTGYRAVAIAGGACAVAGAYVLTGADPGMSRGWIFAAMLLVGLGLGFMSTPYVVAVQTAVPWHRRGIATSSVQFFRTIGGSIAIAALGALLNHRLEAELGPDVDPSAALRPELRAELAPEALLALTGALDRGLDLVFLALTAVAVVGLATALSFPRGAAASHAYTPPPG